MELYALLCMRHAVCLLWTSCTCLVHPMAQEDTSSNLLQVEDSTSVVVLINLKGKEKVADLRCI